jgi:hypothetical protein
MEDVTGEHVVYDLANIAFEVRKIRTGSPSPATLPALACRPASLLRTVGMVRVTKAGAIDSYALATASPLRASGT